MSCCGKARNAVAAAASTGAGANAASPGSPSRSRHYAIHFEYAGATGLTAIGPVTGRRYRFEYSGARLQIDPRDRPGLAAVPGLKQVT